ncbi:MAG: LacI family transcriptional regulator, partial [Lachnospiraceae bacterium]|nr:LacI family transcriptional regulator [Lachnospiraceae bacterium]
AYVPSMAGILLSQNNSRIVGVVVNNHEKYENKVLEDAFIAASLNALLFTLEQAGYFMMVKASTEWNEIIRFASMWNMEGLVLIGFCESDYKSLRENMHIPFVVYDGYFEENKGICNIIIDNYDGGVQVGRYLYQKGHRKVLCISDNNICTDKERMDGCRNAMGGATVDFMQVPLTAAQRHDFYHMRLAVIRQYSAVFAVSDTYAIELMHFLQEQGMQIPKEISIVGFDNMGLCERVYPCLTTVGQDAYERAKAAVAALQKLKAGETTEAVQKIHVYLVERESVWAYDAT